MKFLKKKKYLTEMTMYDCRIHFLLRSRMFSCKMNFLNDPKFKADMWRCDSCEKCIDSQSHILYCPAYIQLREGKSLSSDQDIVDYFKEVLRIRTKLNIDKWFVFGLCDCNGKSPLVDRLGSKICRGGITNILFKLFGMAVLNQSDLRFAWTYVFCPNLLQ